MFDKNRSLFSALIIYFVGISLTIVGLISFLSSRSLEKTVVKGVESIFFSMMRQSSDHLSKEFETFHQQARTLAASPSLMQLINAPNFARDAWQTQVQSELQQFLKDNLAIEAIQFINLRENNQFSVHRDWYSGLVDTNVDNQLVHDVATRLNKSKTFPFLMELMPSQVTGKKVIPIIHPVGTIDESQGYTAYLQIDVSIEYIGKILKSIESSLSSDNTISAILINENGTVLSSFGPMASWFLKEFKNDLKSLGSSSDHPLVKITLKEGSEEVPYEIYTFSANELKWSITILIPKNLIFGEVYTLQRSLVVIVFLGMLVTILLAFLVSRSVTQPVSNLIDSTKAIQLGNLDLALPPKSFKEINILSAHFGKMAARLKETIAEKIKESEEKALLQHELATAGLLQTIFLPKKVYETSHFDLHAYFQPASAVGGDWYAYYLTKNNQLHIHVGDVTGHGTASALLAAFAKGATDMIYEEFQRKGQEVPLEFLHFNLHSLLAKDDHTSNLMTLFSLSIDLNTKELRYINSGHMPQILSTSDNKKPKLLLRTQSSSLLGFGKKNAPEHLQSFIVEGGETILLYSDGLFEIPKRSGDKFSLKTIARFFQERCNMSAQQISEEIRAELDLGRDAAAPDDITYIVLKLKIGQSGILAG
ncbi:MAG: SpoIIE family protein phosphatase [Oligoflexales bacterium]